MSMDQDLSVTLSYIIKSGRLTVELLNEVLSTLLHKIQIFKQDKQPFPSKLEHTVQGKQSSKTLFKKHVSGIAPIQDDLTKEQVKDYQKEFKKVGVDFSVVKNGKDSYSIYFNAKDAETIEKGIQHAVEKRSLKNEKKQQRKTFFTINKLRQKQEEINRKANTKEKEYTRGAI